jgi:alpha-galactosidase
MIAISPVMSHYEGQPADRRHSVLRFSRLVECMERVERFRRPDACALTSRREFVELAALSAAGLSLPGLPFAHAAVAPHSRSKAFLDLRRPPDSVLVQTATSDHRLTRAAGGRWTSDEVVVTMVEQPGALHVGLFAPRVAVRRLHLRWRGPMADTRLIVGDAWERGYGDLEWRSWIPDRVMPWYFATYDGSRTYAFGVRTGAKALCYWQVDPQGISLWADVRSGSAGVLLGERVLDVCDVVCRAGLGGESAFAALHAFCRLMCSNPRLPAQPIYGSNDWYWAYGKNSAATVVTDAQHIAELSPVGGNRPFAVIDDGWQPVRGQDRIGIGTWDRGNEKFPDMPGLAAAIRRAGARPGIWTRPLQATADAPDTWRLPRDRAFLDPTVPEVRQKIADDITRLRTWGYELIKHDYTTFDIFGRWGFQMGAALTRDGWTFASGPARTTAEVIDELYGTIRTAAGESLIIGCNTVSHLSAGHFEICRVGDDTSGTEWSRTRKMGVNTLAFRGAQHGAFYVADADCVGVTNAVPWAYNRQWLDLLARSGTMLFVSLAPDALGAEQRRDLKAAFALAARPQPLAEPLDWQRTVYPSRWRLMGREVAFEWVGADGAGPP